MNGFGAIVERGAILRSRLGGITDKRGRGSGLSRVCLYLLIGACLVTSGCKEDWVARLGLRTLWRNCVHPFEAYPLEQLTEELTADPPRLSFVVLGNTDLAWNEPERGEETTPFGRIMGRVRSIHPQPGFVFHLGDIARECGDVKAWEALRVGVAPFEIGFPAGGLYDPGSKRCFVLPGERDVEDKQTEGDFLDYFFRPSGRLPYSFDWEDFHFVALNSETTDDSWLMRYFGFNRQQNRIAGTQRDWLEEDLAKNQDKKIVVFIHKPLFPPVFSRHEGYCLDQYYSDREKLLDLFKAHSVRVVFTGHEPVFQWTRIADTCYVITGGAGRRPKAVKRFGGFHHFLYVTIDEASRMKVYCIDAEYDAVQETVEIM